MTRGVALAVALAAAGLCQLTHAQQMTYRTGVDLVRLDVLAVDRRGPIANLGRDDFELWDSGKLQVIDGVTSESDGIDLVLCLDTSDSVDGEMLGRLKEAARALLDSLERRDRAQLLTFSHRVQVRTPLTGDLARVRRAVDAVDASGSTSLLDALYTALALKESDARRSMVLLFSDGRDNQSWLSAEDVREVIRQTDAIVYAVAHRPHPRGTVWVTPPDANLLERVTNDAGGRLVWSRDSAATKATFLRLLAEMRSRYVLTYYPREVPSTGWHPIRVALKSGKGAVTARPGYMVDR